MGKFLIVLGSIIAVLSGGCSLLAVAESGLDDLFIGYVVIFGGVPFVFGTILLLVGIAVQKHKVKREASGSQNP